MSRTVYLENAAEDGITAKLDNGVLDIVIPKIEKKESKKPINIE